MIYCLQKKEECINTLDFLEIKDVKNDLLITKDKYIKILKVHPINYDLKSDFEKQSILNSYKTVLKTCNFNFQILILSEKEDIAKMIEELNNIHFSKTDSLDKIKFIDSANISIIEEKKSRLNKIYENYINFIEKINYDENITSKSFYIIISEDKKQESNKINISTIFKSNKNKGKEKANVEKINDLEFINTVKSLNDKEKKIITSINRCGNNIKVLKNEEIYKLFKFNKRREGA